MKKNSTDYIKKKWERELDTDIPPEDWSLIIHTQMTTTNSQGWRDFSCKNCMRFFITPKIKSKQSGCQIQCWRQCGQLTAVHTHLFWSCPALQPFWAEVQAATKIILGFDIEFTCLSFYLGHMSEELDIRDEYLVKILMVASKKQSLDAALLKNLQN